MNNFYLSDVPRMAAKFKTLSLTEFRSLVNSAVHEMIGIFDGWEDEIEDWANAGYSGRPAMMNHYCRIEDHSLCQIECLKHFDELIDAFLKRERYSLKQSLERKYSKTLSPSEFANLATF